MKKVALATFVLLLAATAFAQPDPADSIILESKTVAPGHRGETDTSAYLYVKVYITNKDSLVFLTLALKEATTTGGAYAILGRPRTFTGVINPLTPSFRYGSAYLFRYDSSSPDSFVVGAGADVIEPSSTEPPNGVRKAVWEIKFDSVLNYAGKFVLDTATVLGIHRTMFTNTVPVDLPVNFVKSTITVPFSTVAPDPRDSIILESRTVQPGSGRPYTTVKVYITNKDSLAFMILALKEVSTSGGAFGVLSRTESGYLTFSSVVTTLTPTLRDFGVGNFNGYGGASPDTFLLAAGYDPGDPTSVEPPNATRKAIWEIKFDTVRSGAGTFELDSAVVLTHQGCYFSSFRPANDVPVNLVKSVIAVYPKGDFNGDLALSGADIVILLNCIFGGEPAPGGALCDVNCDGQSSGADVVLEVNAVFNLVPFPC